MPTMDSTGLFYARGVPTAKGSRAALGFPIRASRASTARRFADKMILELLPGWDTGVVALTRNAKRVDSWLLKRGMNHDTTRL
ncbi:hypothetical protein LCGC14_0754290 [marine sediment metagenome]|uniref:Uncharacterized protein n=1 Tax=marine sediment metagenome TaxID=412755 RepID=A0A0F9Q7C1_9ZZZZ